MKFLHINGNSTTSSPTYSTIAINGGPIRPINKHDQQVGIERPSGDGVEPVWFGSPYSPFVGMVLNSNVRYNGTDDVVHLQAVGFTKRTEPEQSTVAD